MRRLQKLLSVMLVVIMMATLVSGCKKTKETTMFTVIEEAAEVTEYSYEMTLNIESDEDVFGNIEVKLSGETDGERTTVGAKVKVQGISLKFEDALIIESDAIYINIGELSSALKLFLGASMADIAEDMEWIKLEFADEYFTETPKESGTYSFMADRLETALDEFEIESEDGVHSVTIESIDEVIVFLEAFYDTLEDSEDEYEEKFGYLYDKDHTEILYDTIEQWLTTVIEAQEKYKQENNLPASTEEELAESYEVMNDYLEVIFSDVEGSSDASFDSLLESIEILVNALEDLDEDSAEVEINIANSVTGKEGAREFTTEISADIADTDSGEEIIISFECITVENKDIEIKLPKDVADIEDIVYIICEYADASGYYGNEHGYSDTVVSEPDTEPETETQTETVETSKYEYIKGADISVSAGTINPAELILYGDCGEYILTYDADVVMIDDEMSDGKSDFYFMVNGGDTYIAATIGDYDSTAQDLFAAAISIYGDDCYSDIVITEPYELTLDNLTLTRFDISYTYSDGNQSFNDDCGFYCIELGNGDIIYGRNIGDYYMNGIMSFDEYLAHLFYDLDVAGAQAEVPTVTEGNYQTVDVNVCEDTGRVVRLGYYDDNTSLYELSTPEEGMVIFDYYPTGADAVLFVTIRDDMTLDDLYNTIKSNNSNSEVSNVVQSTIGDYIGYRFDISHVAENGETVTYQYFCVCYSYGIIMCYAFCDEPSVNTACITIEDLVPYIIVDGLVEDTTTEPATEPATGTTEAANTETITMSYKNATIDLTYNADYVYLEEAYSNLADGMASFSHVDDDNTFLEIMLAEYDSAEALYEKVTVTDAAQYENLSATPMHRIIVNDSIVYRFNISFTETDAAGQEQEHTYYFYAIELGNGYILGGYAMDYAKFNVVAALDEMFSYVFVDVK